MRAYCASLKSSLVNPIEKVFTGPELARAISATMVEESVPPLRNAPSGTSEIKRMRVASSSRCSSSSRHSSSLFGVCVLYCGKSQYWRILILAVLEFQQMSRRQLLNSREGRDRDRAHSRNTGIPASPCALTSASSGATARIDLISEAK